MLVDGAVDWVSLALVALTVPGCNPSCRLGYGADHRARAQGERAGRRAPAQPGDAEQTFLFTVTWPLFAFLVFIS